jgi:hypothetical protein
MNCQDAVRILLASFLSSFQTMKRKLLLPAVLVSLFSFNLTLMAGEETNAAPVRIGIYDSRAVAFAYFWSEPYQKQLKEQIGAAKAAQQSADTNTFAKLKRALSDKQAEMHRQSFSTAPVDDALATIKQRIPEIEKQAGVSALVSKWDEAALKKYNGAEQVDVIGQLVHEFIQPTEKQLKTIESIQKSQPLSLKKCNELIRKGEI